MITFAVYGLDIMETIIPAVQELAARHAGYDVSARPQRHCGRRTALDVGTRSGSCVHP